VSAAASDGAPLRLLVLCTHNSATSVSGEMRGTTSRSNRSWPMRGMRSTRVRIPAANGSPR